MGYGKKIYEEAAARLENHRRAAQEEAQSRLEDFYTQCPRAKAVREEMASNAAGAAKAVVSGGNVKEELTRLKDRGLALRREYEELLASRGLTRQDVEPRYACALCEDTGLVDGRMCQCLRQLQRSLAYQRLSVSVPLEKCTFDAFSLDYYQDDPRACQQMEKVLRACREYGDRLRPNSPSLLFRGGTGLGKTHLSLAIANKALEKGMGVIYGSAQSFAVALEKERFDRGGPEDLEDTNAQLQSCDLLILDDLGTEFPSQYVNAALYSILNVRMLAEKPTVISTNLSMKELEKRYSERFASRIAGQYGMLEFLGSDVRIKRRARQRAKE